MDFACPLLGAVDGRAVEDGLLVALVAFDVLGVAVFGGLGVSFRDRAGSFVVPFGVVGVSGAFSLLLFDREVTAGTLALCRGNFFGVPINISPSKMRQPQYYRTCTIMRSLVEAGRMLSEDFANLSVAEGLIDLPSTSTRLLLVVLEPRDDTDWR